MVRAYFDDPLVAAKAVISLEALESAYEKGYIVVRAAEEDIDALRRAGMRVVEDDPGSSRVLRSLADSTSLADLTSPGVCAAENGATIAGEIGRRKDLMSTTFRRYAPDQSLLLPPDVRAWLPEGHLAHHVSDLVDGLDLTAFYGAYAGDGRRNAPYAPRMMVKVLLYAYATGVFSSRGIARRLEEDVAFRVLAAGNFPQHRTVCEFRRRHLEDFKALFVEVVRLGAP